MFSPSLSNGPSKGATTNSAPMTTRSRRRQRPLSSDNSLPQPKAKRQRRPLTEQTFADPQPTRAASAAAAPNSYSQNASRQSRSEQRQERAVSQSNRELSVRPKKSKYADRAARGDGTSLLTTNAAYDVRKLPALPDRLKSDVNSRQHGCVDSNSGYALHLTQTHAVVWPYSTSTQAPESFTFVLPEPAKNAADPLPLGALVSSSASISEPGLVVVIPSTGRITYWESISSATTLDFMGQQHTGVEDHVPGMYSGETITQIVNASTAAGFMLSFSSGRVAYLSVRDTHGRPKLSVQFLKTSVRASGGGIFGSIRNAFSHNGIQGEIAAVRTEKTDTPGECSVVAINTQGRIYSWRVHRGGHHDLLGELDFRSTLLETMHLKDSSSAKYGLDSLRILDFCFVPKSADANNAGMTQLTPVWDSDDPKHHLLLLVSLSDGQSCRYSLVEVALCTNAVEHEVGIGMIRPLSTYSTPVNHKALFKPRLYIPRPSLIAFVVFERTVVLTSLAQQPESPESQLLQDSHAIPATFEDVIDFRDDQVLEIIGTGTEEPDDHDEDAPATRVKSKNPTALLFVRGAGILRIVMTDVERFATEQPPVITAKSKLEQAVFFGIKEDNPLTFEVRREQQFTDSQYGGAALSVSSDILTSSGPHLSSLASRVDDNIQERVHYLQKLMAHIKASGIKLKRVTKWKLLWNAEKMHVASTVWRKHEDFVNSRPAESRKSIIAEIVEYIRAEEKSEPNTLKGEVDQLRHWFLKDVDRMELFIAWAYEVIKHSSRAGLDSPDIARLIYEASEIYNDGIRDAFGFRTQNLRLYGLTDDRLENGIIAGNYEGLPEPWTCSPLIANSAKRHLELASESIKQHLVAVEEGKAASDNEFASKIQAILPPLTEVYLSILQELSRAYLASDDAEKLASGRTFASVYEQDRHDKVVLLADSGNWEAAIEIAEHHKSLPALAQIMIRHCQLIKAQSLVPGITKAQADRNDAKYAAQQQQIKGYIMTYGKKFAFPYYEGVYSQLGVNVLLEDELESKYKTMYLRTKPQLAKISWINDVVQEKDIDHAADTLLNLGLSREQQLWNKKIELSLGKLARMAEACEPSQNALFSAKKSEVKPAQPDARLVAVDKELSTIEIQQMFYSFQVQPIIHTALDDASEENLVLEAFALKHPKKYKILSQIFEDALRRLLKHEALDTFGLIDLLTLVTLPDETKTQMPDQFLLALRVAYNGLEGEERYQSGATCVEEMLSSEDWTKINNTVLKNDSDVTATLSHTDLFGTYCQLFADQQSGTENLQRVLPSEAAGVFTDTLDRRFEKLDKGYREKLFEAMRWEDGNLAKHLEKHRLEQWAQEAQKLAEGFIKSQLDAATAEGATVEASGTFRKARKGSRGRKASQ